MKFRTAVIVASYETSSKRAIIPQLLHIQREGADFSPLSLSLLSSFTVNCTEEAATSAPEVARPIEYRVRISTWRSYDAQLLLSRLLKSPRSPSVSFPPRKLSQETLLCQELINIYAAGYLHDLPRHHSARSVCRSPPPHPSPSLFLSFFLDVCVCVCVCVKERRERKEAAGITRA